MRDVEDEAYWKKKTLEHLGVEVDGDDGEADLRRRAGATQEAQTRTSRCYVCDRQIENGYFLSRASVRVCMKCCRAQGIEKDRDSEFTKLTINGKDYERLIHWFPEPGSFG